MAESRETLLAVSDPFYPEAVARALDAASHASDPVRAGVEAVTEIAEEDPERARTALWRLQTDWSTLRRLEEKVGGDSTLATLRIGAVIHLARAELASPNPRLRRMLPELLEWLGRRD